MSTAGNPRSDRATRDGFTLIELILVMSILLVVLSVSAPMLTTFFRGRTLDAEARRFLALTHYAQSRAVSEGLPMTLWIDSSAHKYGLEIQAGYAEDDEKAAEYALERDLEIEVVVPAVLSTTTIKTRKVNTNEKLIRFTPDGFIGEDNPEAVILRQGAADAVSIAPNRNRFSYVIETNSVRTARR